MCTALPRRGFSRKTSEKADLVCSCDVVCSALTRAGGLQMNVVFKGKGQISLPRSRYMERYFGCSFFTTFFLREKESGGKKSAYKGDCAAIRYAPIRRSLPLIYPPDDCSADSDLASYRPKRSASIMPRVSYLENARIKLSFFTHG